MNILWTKGTQSGIGDRLIDLLLVSTYAKIKDGNLYLNWPILQNNYKHTWKKNDDLIGEWEDVRYHDYLYENLIEYFHLPKNVFINKTPSIIDEYFDHYLGGVYSPFTFYENFLKGTIEYQRFIETFFNTCSELHATSKLKSIVGDLHPDLSLHIRRQDKIRRKDSSIGEKGFEFIEPEELDFLRNKTFDIFTKIYKTNDLVYIASDEDEEKFFYKNKFNTKTSEDFIITENFVKTYVDLYLLSKSKKIILSQRHSNFSILASLLNKSILIYIFDNNCNIREFKFDELDNLYHYEYFLNNKDKFL